MAFAVSHSVVVVVVSVYQQIRDARLKQGNGFKCRRGIVAEKTVNGSYHGLKSDAEKKTKTGSSPDMDKKFLRAADGDAPSRDELASERMWEDISDASEMSDRSSSYSDLLAMPATTTVTVVGNGLLQVSPADPLIRRFSLGSDETKTSTGLEKHRCLWNEVVAEQDWQQSVEDLSVSLTDADGHPHHLVQMQNILPLFIYGMNNDGNRSVQLAVIGDHKLSGEYLSPSQTAGFLSAAVSSADRNNHVLPKSTYRRVIWLTFATVNNGNVFPFIFCRNKGCCRTIIIKITWCPRPQEAKVYSTFKGDCFL